MKKHILRIALLLPSINFSCNLTEQIDNCKNYSQGNFIEKANLIYQTYPDDKSNDATVSSFAKTDQQYYLWKSQQSEEGICNGLAGLFAYSKLLEDLDIKDYFKENYESVLDFDPTKEVMSKEKILNIKSFLSQIRDYQDRKWLSMQKISSQEALDEIIDIDYSKCIKIESKSTIKNIIFTKKMLAKLLNDVFENQVILMCGGIGKNTSHMMSAYKNKSGKIFYYDSNNKSSLYEELTNHEELANNIFASLAPSYNFKTGVDFYDIILGQDLLRFTIKSFSIKGVSNNEKKFDKIPTSFEDFKESKMNWETIIECFAKDATVLSFIKQLSPTEFLKFYQSIEVPNKKNLAFDYFQHKIEVALNEKTGDNWSHITVNLIKNNGLKLDHVIDYLVETYPKNPDIVRDILDTLDMTKIKGSEFINYSKILEKCNLDTQKVLCKFLMEYCNTFPGNRILENMTPKDLPLLKFLRENLPVVSDENFYGVDLRIVKTLDYYLNFLTKCSNIETKYNIKIDPKFTSLFASLNNNCSSANIVEYVVEKYPNDSDIARDILGTLDMTKIKSSEFISYSEILGKCNFDTQKVLCKFLMEYCNTFPGNRILENMTPKDLPLLKFLRENLTLVSDENFYGIDLWIVKTLDYYLDFLTKQYNSKANF